MYTRKWNFRMRLKDNHIKLTMRNEIQETMQTECGSLGRISDRIARARAFLISDSSSK